MRSDWRSGTVEEVAQFENRLRIPLSAEQRAERPGEYPYWGANGPFDTVDDFLFEGARVLVAEDGNTVVRPDGRGTVHWATGRYWVNNHAHVLNVKPGHDLRWLFYALSGARVRDFVTGSAQPKLSMGSLKQLPLPVPPPTEQRRISSLLGALDDKIESNRRLAGLLEETVATMFRARFVDFVGVEEFDESEIGRVPRGWRVAPVGNVVKVVGGARRAPRSRASGTEATAGQRLRICLVRALQSFWTPIATSPTRASHKSARGCFLLGRFFCRHVRRWATPRSATWRWP
jgi:restriction endonuclease S subunit